MNFSRLIIEDTLNSLSELLTRERLIRTPEHTLSRLFLSIRFQEKQEIDRTWNLSLRNELTEKREIAVVFVVPALATGWRLFVPSSKAHPSWEQEVLEYGYRDSGVEMSVPSATVYHPEVGRGFSFFPDLRMADQHFKVTCNHLRERNILRIACTHLAMTESGMIEVTLRVIEHGGEWDAGLRYIRESFPEFSSRFPSLSSDEEMLAGPA
jgi:hypothetical protein